MPDGLAYQPLSALGYSGRFNNFRPSNAVEDYRLSPLDPMAVALGDKDQLSLRDLSLTFPQQDQQTAIPFREQMAAAIPVRRGMFDEDIQNFAKSGAKQGRFGLTGEPRNRFGLTLLQLDPVINAGLHNSALGQLLMNLRPR